MSVHQYPDFCIFVHPRNIYDSFQGSFPHSLIIRLYFFIICLKPALSPINFYETIIYIMIGTMDFTHQKQPISFQNSSKTPEKAQEAQEWSKYTLNHIIFNLPSHYKPLKLIGQGTYGSVALCIDQRIPIGNGEDCLVAIKKMCKIFQSKKGAIKILRELKLLRLMDHPNLVKIKNVLVPKSEQQFQDLYIVFQRMESDLHELIKRNRGILEQSDYQLIIYEILKGLKFIHSADVLHRDIKTKNILINGNFDVQICDFGMVRPIMNHSKLGILSEYVTTRWYRAPQILMGQTNYTTAVDVWSVGCILAEFLFNEPLLRGQSTKQQLELISQLMEIQDLQQLKKKNIKLYNTMSKNFNKKKKRFAKKSEGLSILGLDLLKKMLQFNPMKRITINQALQHPFFLFCRDPSSEISRDPIDSKQFEFQNQYLTISSLKKLIYSQILLSNEMHLKNMETSRIKDMSETTSSENSDRIILSNFEKEQFSFIIE